MNGVVVSRSDGSNVKAVQASAPLHVGRYYDGQYPFDGNISSLIFAKDEWSENEVQRVMKHTIGKGGEVSEINKALSDRVRPPCNCMIFHH